MNLLSFSPIKKVIIIATMANLARVSAWVSARVGVSLVWLTEQSVTVGSITLRFYCKCTWVLIHDN